MPCYQVQTYSVKFQMANFDLLSRALGKLNWNVKWKDDRISLFSGGIVLDLEKQEARVEDRYQNKLNELKRVYSIEAIDKVAKLNMWSKKMADQQHGVLRRF